MGVRGRVMFSLAAISGASVWGCMQTSLPPASMPSASSPTPGVPQLGSSLRVPSSLAAPTLPHLGPTPAVPAAVSNPWKPKVAAREWNSIVIHHTATNRGSVASIHETHLQRTDGAGNHWLGIGYHFVIGNGNGMNDGEIEPTFRWREQMHGAHAGDKEHNQHGIGICLVGNFDEAPPSSAQLAAVKRLVGVLKAEYGINSDQVIGHSDIKATECPGKYFPMAEVSYSPPQILWGAAPSASETVKLARQEGNRN